CTYTTLFLSLLQIIQDIIKKYLENEVFLFSSYVVCIMAGTKEELDEVKDIFTKDIIDTTNKLIKEEVVIGVSENYLDIFKTRKAYIETFTALDYIKKDDEENIIFFADVENTAYTTYFLDDIYEVSS